jgi:hypothetical protein
MYPSFIGGVAEALELSTEEMKELVYIALWGKLPSEA